MKSSLYVIVFFICITLSQFAHSQAWDGKVPWNGMATELEYQQWFLDNVTTDFYFKKTGLLKGEVGVDCGKAAYVARAVFAYETGRRFLARGHDNTWIDSSAKVAYTGTPEQKMRAFLKTELIRKVNVESMKDNTFPIQVDRSTLTAGTVFNFQMPGFESNEAGRHAYIVKEITPGGYIRFIWATVPIAPRMLSERTLYPVYMPTNVSVNNQWGFRRFYQPQDFTNDVLTTKAKIPLNGRLDSAAAMDAEIKMQEMLKSRGYNATHQNDLAKEVLSDLEIEKESRRIVGGFVSKPPAKISASKNTNIQTEKSILSQVTPPGPYIAAPGWRPITLIDVLSERSREQLNKSMGIGQNSIVDQILVDARASLPESNETAKPRTTVVRKITFPPLKQNGTFVSDPDSIVEGVSVIKIYHGKLITLLQYNKETLEQNLQRQYFNLCSYLEDRQSAVEEGYMYFFVYKKIVSASNTFNRCPTKDEMYNYTTPERDSELKDYVLSLKNFYYANRDEIKATLPDWFLSMEYSLAEPMHVQTLSVASMGYKRLQKALNATRVFLPKGQQKNYCEIMLDLRHGGNPEPMSIRRFVPIITSSYNFLNALKQSVVVPLVSVVPSVNLERRWGLHGLNQALYDAEYNINIDCTGQSQAEHGAEATEPAKEAK